MPQIKIVKGDFRIRFTPGDPVTEAAEGETLLLTDEEVGHWYTRAAIDDSRATRLADGAERQEVADVSPDKAEPEPADIETRMLAIFPQLTGDDYKTDGTPKVRAVETLLGENVTADQVALVWDNYQAGRE